MTDWRDNLVRMCTCRVHDPYAAPRCEPRLGERREDAHRGIAAFPKETEPLDKVWYKGGSANCAARKDGRMMATYDDCRQAALYTLHEGGGTFCAPYLDPVEPLIGYAVGLVCGTWEKCNRSVNEILATLSACTVEFPDAPYIGTWVEDEETVHVDPVVILFHVDDAMTLGRALGQKAIYSFAAKNEIRL